MAEVAEVRRRVCITIDRAKQTAAARRARADVDEELGRKFIQHVATPVAQQVVSVLKAEGFHYSLSTPLGAVRLVSERHREDFIDLALDATQDPVTIMTLVSHVRGQRVSTTERPLYPGHSIDQLTEDHVLEFLLEALQVFVER
jgi:hypothetical protein